MENSYKFYENRQCKYWPCHSMTEPMNCQMCFCPLFHIKCPFDVKNCEHCTYPHRAENYEDIIKRLIEHSKGTK